MGDDEKDLGLFDRKAALMKLPADAQVVAREHVEKVAAILGPESQAAKALARADEHAGSVQFWYSLKAGMLWLELAQDMRH